MNQVNYNYSLYFRAYAHVTKGVNKNVSQIPVGHYFEVSWAVGEQDKPSCIRGHFVPLHSLLDE